MNIKDLFFNLVFTKKCAVCNKTIHIGYDICLDCEKTLRPIHEETLRLYVNAPVLYVSSADKPKFDGLAAPFYHQDGSKNIVYNYKFYGRKELYKFLGINMVNTFNDYYSNIKFDYICCVPTTFSGVITRGFNHTKTLSKYISKLTHIKYKSLIYQYKRKMPQHKMSAAKRVLNVKGIYKLKNNVDVKNKSILLIDDIISTGSTLNECAKVLKSGGAKNVYCLSATINV